ncbi:UDP-N-acetylmuramate dehydrogenase [Thiopseudomonas denitrificans]|uniref:UDP-N-acetylenolpyruvoylglucosamine reductase n=1 Tax=Thiopseudomonas denitrificans TaxID=1501432 RepID=A0A4V3D5J2_9GAMM|nr:UDP-N-acetylmuramate dehydrogenase [Thiopseudomonas denitrificans]TDQ40277.1 UDP-N-acetylmuramate dehydrogenase [Thiopseudomonas denitrificans]
MSFQPQEQVDLRPYNTLGVSARARYFTNVRIQPQLQAAMRWAIENDQPWLLLGGGSNLVLAGDVPGLVIRLEMSGKRVVHEDDEHVWVRAQAGENWHELVRWTLEQGWSGLENLSLIPGTAGAAPVQNVGAYGVEVRDVLQQVLVLDALDFGLKHLSVEECRFDYRDSLFKREPGRRVILSIDLRLRKRPQLQLEYGPIRAELERRGISEPTPLDISDAVIAIRQSKLPDPAVLSNAGSFFKNPVIAAGQAAELKQRYPEMVQYPLADGQVKLAAGWLIEQAGWKGKCVGDACVHQQQALVLVNHGAASGADVLALAAQIREDIAGRYGVNLEIEPVVIDAE